MSEDLEVGKVLYEENGYPIIDRETEIIDEVKGAIDDLRKGFLFDYNTKIENGLPAKLRQVKQNDVKRIVYKVIFDKVEKVDHDVAQSMTKDQLFDALNDFFSLLSAIGEYCDFAPSKQLFAAFCGISVTDYNALLEAGDEEQRQALDSIESAIVDLALDSAAIGALKDSTTRFRMTVKGTQGHGLVQASAADKVIDKAVDMLTPKDSIAVIQQVEALCRIEQAKK